MNKLTKNYLIITFAVIVTSVSAQNNSMHISLLNENRESTSLFELAGKNEIVVVSFWATWCKPCITELNTISDEIEDWKEEVNFTFVAVSIDDSRSSSKVKSLVNGSGWEFEIALDQNQDLKRFFGVNNIPYTIVLKNSKVEYRHAGYLSGDEIVLWLEIQKLNE